MTPVKNSLVLACIFISRVALAEVCIPREFAVEGVTANYEKLTAEKKDELAKVQKEYAEFIAEVEDKKKFANRMEITNAFVDAAGMAYLIHWWVDNMKAAKDAKEFAELSAKAIDPNTLETNLTKLTEEERQKFKRLRKNVEKIQEKVGKLESGVEGLMDAGEKDGAKGVIKRLVAGRVEKFENWIKNLKEMKIGGKVKEIFFASVKKIGFTSVLLALPLGTYVYYSRYKEQQRLVELTANQDKVMKQALLFEMFVSQKSFAELAATRAKLHPEKVCPASS